ncbi:hypothetical protein F0C08_22330 [Salmonella enterica]|nr:hypothetical protein [Salmonella enterica]EAV2166390.1 hypothetical protein [Salmonella enterica]ECQ3212821.1 hypothetical protein [Salmonella enterica]ECQ4802970.1 hypothetical protein [Salmonella enterica]ECX9754744.1 hypothetical protein [Salmonella enterica]
MNGKGAAARPSLKVSNLYGMVTFVQDRPSDTVWTYTRSNVVMPDEGTSAAISTLYLARLREKSMPPPVSFLA